MKRKRSEWHRKKRKSRLHAIERKKNRGRSSGSSSRPGKDADIGILAIFSLFNRLNPK